MSLMLTGTASAQAWSTNIGDPVPSALRGRIADLMRNVRAADVEAAVAQTRIIDRFWREHGLLILRVEADCQEGLCMPLIAKVTDGAIVPEMTLRTGSKIMFYDAGMMLWRPRGPSFPIVIEGPRGTGTELYERDGTWVVQACANCFPDRGELPRLGPAPDAAQPAMPNPPETIEAFRRSLGLDP